MLGVIIVGLGPIGVACARAVLEESDLKLVALIDQDQTKLGKTLDQLGESSDQEQDPDEEPCPIRVTSSIDDASARDAQVAIVTTTSRFDVASVTITELVARGLHVISSCEEMVWPWYQHDALAQKLDAHATAAGKVVLGTGVNPGFVMDSLAVTLASVVRRATGVRCTRRVQAGTRRRALQAKIGATLRIDRFAELKSQKKIGHVGLPESVALLAAGLGYRVEPGSVVETLDPVIATTATPSAIGLIEPGLVSGIHNTATWYSRGFSVTLDLWMAVGLPDPKDVLEIEGPVQLHMKIPGSIPGDSATVAIIINAIHRLSSLSPGLRTMLDVPPLGCRGRDRA